MNSASALQIPSTRLFMKGKGRACCIGSQQMAASTDAFSDRFELDGMAFEWPSPDLVQLSTAPKGLAPDAKGLAMSSASVRTW